MAEPDADTNPGRRSDQPSRTCEADAEAQGKTSEDLSARARSGRLWIYGIAAIFFGAIGCMCAFIFIIAATML